MSIITTNNRIPEAVSVIDQALVDIDHRVDWLYNLSPLDNDYMWQSFVDSGYSNVLPFRYPEPQASAIELRESLNRLPINDIQLPIFRLLMMEKKREIDLFIELVQLRDQEGFIEVSIELFGAVDPQLLRTANAILTQLNDATGTDRSSELNFDASYIDALEFHRAAEAELQCYREQHDDFSGTALILEDLNSQMMVHNGHLKIAQSLQLERARLPSLIAHEIGTHVVTSYNGSRQPLKLLEVGLAHYDALQEGLGTLAEYLAGYLPPYRLQVIAARVIAADMVVKDHALLDIFSHLHEQSGLNREAAFDIAVRACRGGGLTKDAVYLKGLCELLAYLQSGGDINLLFLGKYAMAQVELIRKLQHEGWIESPTIIPRHLTQEPCQRRLDTVRKLAIESLYQRTPDV